MHGIGTIGLVVIALVVAFLILPMLGLSGILIVIGVLALLKGHLLGGIVCIAIGFAVKPRRY
ncbi:MAG: hypothetical protein WC714_19235 [Candidatus Obscuribacterales bacterium]|jgi:hypothetical protein